LVGRDSAPATASEVDTAVGTNRHDLTHDLLASPIANDVPDDGLQILQRVERASSELDVNPCACTALRSAMRAAQILVVVNSHDVAEILQLAE
jgi:hypothetical protein